MSAVAKTGTERHALDATRVRRLDNGTIIVPARIARSGLQSYAHGVAYRPVEEVTDAASLASIAHVAVTVGHPPAGWVELSNWKDYAVGTVVGEPRIVTADAADDGAGETFVEVDLHITDAAAVRDVLNGKLTELSSGYKYRQDDTRGEVDGKSYHFVQREIRHNHQALLPTGGARAGRLAKVLLDSEEQIQVDEKDFKALEATVNQLKAELDALTAKHAKLEADKAQVDEALEQAKAKEMAQDAIDRAVDEQLKLRQDVAVLVKGDYPFGSTKASEVHRAVLAKVYPGKIAADASDAYLKGRFDAVVEARKSGEKPVVRPGVVTADSLPTPPPDAYSAHLARLQNINPSTSVAETK